MSTVTMLSVTGHSKYDGKGSAPLASFKHIADNKEYIKKHRYPHVTCKADVGICILQAEMRLVKRVKMVECRFEDPGNEFNNFAVNLEGIYRRQEVTGFEEHRLFAVYLYLTDDSKSQIPTATDMGVKLKDVAIMSFKRIGNEIIVAFSGMDAKTNI